MRAGAELVDMMGAAAPENAQTAASSSPQAAEDDPELPHPTKKCLGSYFKKVAQATTHSEPSRASIELELAMYLQAPGPDSETEHWNGGISMR